MPKDMFLVRVALLEYKTKVMANLVRVFLASPLIKRCPCKTRNMKPKVWFTSMYVLHVDQEKVRLFLMQIVVKVSKKDVDGDMIKGSGHVHGHRTVVYSENTKTMQLARALGFVKQRDSKTYVQDLMGQWERGHQVPHLRGK